MITQDQLRTITGSTAYDRSGDKIGKIGAVYFDDQTDQPKWLTVHTGLFGTNETFVPVEGADVSGDRVTLAYEKAQVKDAPNISEDGHLSPQDEEQLYTYYGVGYSGGNGDRYDDDTTGTRTDRAGLVGDDVETGRHASEYREGDYREGEYREGGVREGEYREGGVREGVVDRDRDSDGVYDDVEGRAVGHDTSGPTTDQAITRSEEQLRVGTETREAGRARLRKYVVTEQENVTVPVTREEVRLEREPITDANRGEAYDGPAISEEEHEVVLHEERPVVDTEAVAVERVRLDKETVTEHENVRGEVRKEQIEFDGADDLTGRGVRDSDGDYDRDRGLVGDRDRVVGDRDGDGVPDSVDRHDDRSVGEKVKDAVTPDRTDRR